MIIEDSEGSKFKTVLLVFMWGIVFVWLFGLTYIIGGVETHSNQALQQANQTEQNLEKIQYHIENQRDTIIINIQTTNKNSKTK